MTALRHTVGHLMAIAPLVVWIVLMVRDIGWKWSLGILGGTTGFVAWIATAIWLLH